MTTAQDSMKQFLYSAILSIVLILVVTGVVLTSRLSAQVVGATVSGTVVDASGAVTPNVTISFKNVATENIRNAVTNGQGFYIAPNLPAGPYEVSASASGFATQVRTGITL